MKKILQIKLKILAKLILRKYQPDIVGITGSVGKTSAKEAVYAVLSYKHGPIRQNIKNYNNELGLPLTIIGQEAAGRSLYGWIKVFIKAIKLLVAKDMKYPKILVLEMGVDRPGDMSYLTSIVKCRIGIETLVGPVHIKYFGTIDKIKKEKEGLVKNLQSGGWAVLNYDDENVRSMANDISSRIMTYGMDAKALVRAQEIIYSFEKSGEQDNLRGLSFKLTYNGSFVPVLLPNAISHTAVYAALAGACVGIIYGMNLVEISQALREFVPPKGRTNLIPGINSTVIIDDSYNSSPQSVAAALEIFHKIPIRSGGIKWAVLGDMLELGELSKQSHFEIGKETAKNKIDRLIAVGERSTNIIEGAIKNGMNEKNIFSLTDSVMAGKLLSESVKPGDMILVKGSQGMRMEKTVKMIMAEPEKAGELLVRQDSSWK